MPGRFNPLLGRAGKLVTTDEGKAEVLDHFFLPYSSISVSLPTPLSFMDHNTGTDQKAGALLL